MATVFPSACRATTWSAFWSGSTSAIPRSMPTRATNNGMYPGGILTELVYEEMADCDGYKAKVAVDE